MRFAEPFTRLFMRTNRVRLSGYPSNRTPELAEAWKTQQAKFTATVQPYADPLSMYGGNAILNGETWEMRHDYREWSFREPSVKAALMTKCLAVASLDLQIIPNNPKDKRDVEVAKWVKWSLKKIKDGTAGIVQSMLLPGLMDGFSVNEKVNDEVGDNGGPYRGFWTYKRLAMLDSEHLRFKMDEYRQVIGVRPMMGFAGWQELSPEDFVIFTHLKLFENPFGISDLRAVVRSVRMIEAAIKLRHLLLTNFSGPFLIGKSDDDGTKRSLAAKLAQARATGYIVLPKEAELDAINLATAAPDVFDREIQSCREEVVQSIQGGYLQLLEGGVTDGIGNTQVHRGVAELFQWWLATCACEAINCQMIPGLVEPNYGNSVGMPTAQLGGIDPATVQAEMSRFKAGQDLGVPLSIEQVQVVGGFETPQGPEDILKPPQQQQQQGGGGGGPDPFAGFNIGPPKGGAAPGAATFRDAHAELFAGLD